MTNSTRLASNRDFDLKPQIPSAGETLAFDLPWLSIGCAEYPEGPTGCTVFSFSEPVTVAADARGGSCGTIYTLPMLAGDRWLHAICLAGGSFYGLEAALGVAEGIMDQRGRSARWDDIARVAGAVIYDFVPRRNLIHPDKALGLAAFESSRSGFFPLGAHGAGRAASVGKFLGRGWYRSGQGGAFLSIGPVRLAVFTVVNAVGSIIDRKGNVVRGLAGCDEQNAVDLARTVSDWARAGMINEDRLIGNTTLSLIVTNVRLSPLELRRLAAQTHDSMARAIYPFHTAYDGDVLYAVTNNEVDGSGMDILSLPLIASELAWDAVLRAVHPSEAL